MGREGQKSPFEAVGFPQTDKLGIWFAWDLREGASLGWGRLRGERCWGAAAS